ncbi:MAG: hypothetical protein IT307_18850 [Chloroflexi bacterium]|nr:hypothetical protein [Chloroflexota bacterium]
MAAAGLMAARWTDFKSMKWPDGLFARVLLVVAGATVFSAVLIALGSA